MPIMKCVRCEQEKNLFQRFNADGGERPAMCHDCYVTEGGTNEYDECECDECEERRLACEVCGCHPCDDLCECEDCEEVRKAEKECDEFDAHMAMKVALKARGWEVHSSQSSNSLYASRNVTVRISDHKRFYPPDGEFSPPDYDIRISFDDTGVSDMLWEIEEIEKLEEEVKEQESQESKEEADPQK